MKTVALETLRILINDAIPEAEFNALEGVVKFLSAFSESLISEISSIKNDNAQQAIKLTISYLMQRKIHLLFIY